MASTVEDILNDALEFLGEQVVQEDAAITYGPLKMTVAAKQGKANILLADHLFSPSLFLAERIERGLIALAGRTVVELGAGCGLPSLLLSTLQSPPSKIVVTDYPDESILGNLKSNVRENAHLRSPQTSLICLGYEWGKSPDSLLKALGSTAHAFDTIILSDLLHFDAAHDALLQSISLLLSRSSDAVAYIAAGKYTRPQVCDNFVAKARDAGLILTEHTQAEEDIIWEGSSEVAGLDKEALRLRKMACRFWTGQWATTMA